MEKIKTGSFAAKGLIIGGIVVLVSAYDGAQTILPWYVKVTGGLALIIIGIYQITQKRNK